MVISANVISSFHCFVAPDLIFNVEAMYTAQIMANSKWGLLGMLMFLGGTSSQLEKPIYKWIAPALNQIMTVKINYQNKIPNYESNQSLLKKL